MQANIRCGQKTAGRVDAAATTKAPGERAMHLGTLAQGVLQAKATQHLHIAGHTTAHGGGSLDTRENMFTEGRAPFGANEGEVLLRAAVVHARAVAAAC